MLFEVPLGSPLQAIQPPLSWWGLTLAALLLCVRLDAVMEFLHGRLLGVAKLALQAAAAVILAAAFGPVWWHQWKLADWPGPPAWLSKVFEVVTGAAAWSVATEMVVTLCAFLGALILVANLWIAVRPNLSRFLNWS